jgi:hypothetical protein
MIMELRQLGVDQEIVADQVKEKFGGLRFYFSYNPKKKASFIDEGLEKIGDLFFSYTPMGRLISKMPVRLYGVGHFIKDFTYYRRMLKKIYKIVNKAERRSEETCEFCGKPGTQNNSGWITTLCNDCRTVKNGDKS